MTRLKRHILLTIPLLATLVLLGVLSWLLTTSAGLHFVMDKATTVGGINLQYDNLQGTIASKITADRIIYQDQSVEVKLDSLETGIKLFWLLDPRLAFDKTRIDSILVALKDSKKEADKASSSVELPMAISFSSLAVNKISIADTKPLVEINNLLAEQIKVERVLELDKLQLGLLNTKLTLDGSIGLTETSDINIKAAWRIAASESFPALAGKSRVKGNFETLSVRSELSKPQTVHAQTEIKNIFTQPSWKSTLTSNSIDLALLTPATHTRLENVNINLVGDLKSITARGNSLVSDPGYGSWKTQFHGNFSEQQWQLESLQLDSQISDAKVQAVAQSMGNTPYSLKSAFKLSANWQQLQWPLTGKAEYRSNNGKALVNGTLDSYQIATTGDFSFDDYRFHDIVAEGKGSTSALNFESVQITYLDGKWQGNTSLDWSKGFHWTAALKVKGANPGIQWQPLEAKLDGAVSGEGIHQGDDWQIKGDIKNLSGKFRGYPVNGGSQFMVSGKQYAFDQLKLRSGSNTLEGSIAISDYLDNADTRVKAQWILNAGNLNQLFTDAAGSITSRGKADGSLKTPTIDAVATANQFKYQTYVLSKAELKARLNLQRDDKLTISFNAGKSTINETGIEQFALNIDGTTRTHQLAITTKLIANDAIQLRGAGGYQDSQWDGKLTALDINTLEYGKWKLSQPASLLVTDQRMSLSKACIALQNQNGKICTDIDSQASTNYKVNSEIKNLPVALLQNLLPKTVVKIDGMVQGNAQLSVDNDQIKTLQLSLESKGGKLTHTLINNTPTTVNYKQLLLNAKHDKQAISISSNMDLQKTGNAHASLVLADVKSLNDFGPQQSLTGEIDVKIDDLSLLPIFFPDIQSIQGNTSSQFRISGNLGAPKLTGKSILNADRITLPIAGIELKNTQLRAQSSESRKLSFEGSAQSGDGQINVKGEIPDYLAEPLLVKLEVNGKQFLAAKIPDLEMEISPQFSLILEGNTVSMEGEVFVDRAQITPLESYSGLTPSSDVVLIDQQQQKTAPESFKLQGSLRLKLSDRIFVQTAGFNGKVTGELVITESANNVTLATGELIIKDGRYTAPIEASDLPSLLISIAQKELLIDESKLIFAASPIDNPRLDIRARRPTGNEIVVGVDIKGHVNNPQIVLFSEPAMDQADILAYLTLGYPLTEASKNDGQYLARIASSIGLVGGEKLAKNIAKEFGIDEVYIESQDTTQQAQLVLGKYLSPKLYVRYAVGIGEAVDTLQIQYKLTDRWILRTETAETQKGTDLIYTIDK